MKKNILFWLIIISVKTQAQSVWRAEILGRPTDKSITVQAFFDTTTEMCVQYGTSSGTYPNQTPWQTFAFNTPAEITVTGLNPNTQYYYRVCYRKPLSTPFKYRPEHTFHTARPKGETFTFVVQADPHLDEQSDTAVYLRCLQNQLEDKPDFMIDLGDFLMTDKLRTPAKVVPKDTIPFRCDLLRSYYEKVCHSVPLYIALGNHEGESGWNLNNTANNIAVWGALERKKYFVNPAPDAFYTGDTSNQKYIGQRENYYAWQWGDALFIVIDPYWYTKTKPDSLNGWRWTLGKVQYDWLKETLEKSDAKFKFVFSHQIVGGDPDGRGGVEFANRYEWGGQNLDGSEGFTNNRPGWYKPIKDLLEEHRVSIFFHGHDHFFGKQEKGCLIYQETPQPSHPNFQNVNYAKAYGYFEGQILPNSGHIRVTVGPNGVKTEYIRVYVPKAETASRHNKDISATYFIGAVNCYDSLSTGVPVIWNNDYADELVYPNPFMQETKIEFSLDKTEKIKLSIHNENGQLVRVLMNGNSIGAGTFQLVWDGKDGNGNALASGIYWYYFINEDGTTKKGKIVLNR
jgi:predicted phosphodiesterase